MTLLLQILETTLTMSAVIALLLTLSRVFGHRFTAKCRYIVWLVVIVRLCIPVGFTGIAPVFEVSLPERVPVSAVTPEVPATPVEESAAEGIGFYDVIAVLGIVYAVGAATFLSMRVIGYSIFLRHIRRFGMLRSANERAEKAYRETAAAMGIKRLPCLRVTSLRISPFLCGYIRKMIVIPCTVEDDEELSHILAHELTHYRRGDVYVKLLSTAAQSLHWFNPLVHIASARMSSEIEFSCDEAVLRGTDESARVSYGSTMVELARDNVSVRVAALTSHFNPTKSTLKERIMGIIDMDKKKKGIIIIIASVVVCALAGSIIAFAVPSRETPPPAMETEETTAETVETEPETTAEPETKEPETDPVETDPPTPPEPSLNTEILEGIYMDFATLSEKYGRVVKTTSPECGAGYMFKGLPEVTFVWNPQMAHLSSWGSFDEDGLYTDQVPAEGVPCIAVMGKVKDIFGGKDNVEPTELISSGELVLVETVTDSLYGGYITTLDFNGIKMHISHNEADILSADDEWSMPNKVPGVTEPLPTTPPEITDTSFSGRNTLADEAARLQWYIDANERAGTYTVTGWGTEQKISVTDNEIHFIEALLMNDIEYLEESSASEEGVFEEYKDLVIGDYKIVLVESKYDSLSDANDVELDICVIKSSNDVLTPGWHKITFAGDPYPHMYVDGRSSTPWWPQPDGIETLAFKWSMMFMTQYVYNLDDFREMAESNNRRFIELATFCIGPSDETKLTYPDFRYNEKFATWDVSLEYASKYFEEFFGVTDFEVTSNSGLGYKYEDGYFIFGAHGVPVPNAVATTVTLEDGKISVTLEGWADSSMTVRAKTVEYIYEVVDGRLKPVEFKLISDNGFHPYVFSGV